MIDSARFDLVDFVDGIGVGIEFDDAELLNYLNRMVGLMDSQLSALGSDLVEAENDQFFTTANLDFIDISNLNSGLWNRIRQIWWGGKTRIEQVTHEYMRYTRRFRMSVVKSGSTISAGEYIKIISQSTLDFTTIGASDNNNGTYFTATGSGTLGSGDYVWRFSSGRPTIWALEHQKILLPQVAGSVEQITVFYDQKTSNLGLTDNMPYNDIFNEFFREMLVMTAKAKKEGIMDRADATLNEMFRSRAMTETVQRGFVQRPYNYWEF